MTKGEKMNFKTNKKLLAEAMNSGCTTMGQLAIFLKAKSYSQLEIGK